MIDQNEADILDHAATITQQAADREIKAIREEAAKISTHNPSGECWNCGEFTGFKRRWCSPECRDDYEKENA